MNHVIRKHVKNIERISMNTSIKKAATQLQRADAILISASNGLSIAEGYHIFADNDDFKKYFADFRTKYSINCLIRGVFAPLPPAEHERYMKTVHRYLIDDYHGSDIMKSLQKLIDDKPYFIVTSNADTHFQMNGFDEERIFEVEGNFDGMSEGSSQWKGQQERFQSFIEEYASKNLVVFELGIGAGNRLIKAPLMDLVAQCANWKFITLNLAQEINVPDRIESRSTALAGDISETFTALLREQTREA